MTQKTPITFLSVLHPLWLVGFRPFFTLGLICGAVLPVVWVLILMGKIDLGGAGLTPTQWHGHEMFFGFGWAVLGGFLLTASKNWVGIRGLHGRLLALAVLFWLVERWAVLYLPMDGIYGLVWSNLCVTYLVLYLLWTMILNRKADSFSDNYLFWIALPLFILGKNLILRPEYFNQGIAVTVGLFRLSFAIMFERTLTQFMKNAMGVPLPRIGWLDNLIKLSLLAAVFVPFLPDLVGVGLLLLAGLSLLGRLVIWHPHQGMRSFGIGIMYLGYLGLIVHLVFEAAKIYGGFGMIGSLSLHLFTFLCMGMIIPSMMVRISQGHTGRKPVFTVWDKFAISFMLAGAFFRLVATQIWAEHYILWITLAGAGWSLCFALLGFRLIPFMWQARIDGKVH